MTQVSNLLLPHPPNGQIKTTVGLLEAMLYAEGSKIELGGSCPPGSIKPPEIR